MELKSIEKSIIDASFGLFFDSLEKERKRLNNHIIKNHKGNSLSGYRDYKRELEINYKRHKIAVELIKKIKGGF